MLENLKNNKDLLEKGKKFNYYYFLIESPIKINENFKIGEVSYLYQLDQVVNSENDVKDENTKKAIIDLNKIRIKENNTN